MFRERLLNETALSFYGVLFFTIRRFLLWLNKLCLNRFAVVFDVVYEQRERVFHRDMQTRENNEYTSAKRECFCPLFSSVWISQWDTSSSCSYGFSNESRRNRMFCFADLNRISYQAYRNCCIRFV